jgi:hypothetical protein
MIVELNRRSGPHSYGPAATDLPIHPAVKSRAEEPAMTTRSADPVVAVFGHPGRVAGLAGHLPGGWTMRRPKDLDDVHADEIVLFTAATVADVSLARAVLPPRTRVVALVDADAPAETVAGVLTAGADVCVRGGHPAILASHLVACRRRALAERWSHVQA